MITITRIARETDLAVLLIVALGLACLAGPASVPSNLNGVFTGTIASSSLEVRGAFSHGAGRAAWRRHSFKLELACIRVADSD